MGRIVEPTPSVPAFYSGRSILITGATGFLGKVLIEKLLRSCPDTREIYLLMRRKKDASIEERLRQLLRNPLFDKLRSEKPHCFEKLIPMRGDISVEDLDLTPADRDALIEKVSVIFHSAASVRFDDTLKNAVLTNVRSTRDICILGERMKNLAALVFISSSYTQIDKPVIDEIPYPAEVDWRKTIQIAEATDKYILEVFKSKYIDTVPNDYIFTKRLAEQVIIDYSATLPCVICRPSIVTPTLREPLEGWLTNFNGPVALLVGGGKGVLRVLLSDPDKGDNFIPADVVVKAIIVTAWKRGITTNDGDTRDALPSIYNCAINYATNISRFTTMQIGAKAELDIPLEEIIWAPSLIMTKNRFVYYLLIIFLHIIPALFIDGLLRLIGRRPRLLKMQRKIILNNYAISYFLINDWDFRNQKLVNLSSEIPADYQRDFGFAADLNYKYNKVTYFKNCIIGSKIFLLNESMDRLDSAKTHLNIMIWIDKIVKALVSFLFIWTVYRNFM